MKTTESKFQQQKAEKREELREKRKTELTGLANDVRDNAKQDGLAQAESKSSLSIPEIRLKLDGIRFDYQEIGQVVHGWLQPAGTDRLKKIKTDAYQQEEAEVQSELEDTKSRLQNDPAVGNTSPGYLPLSKRLLGALVYVLVLSEVFFDAQAFGGLKIWFALAVLISIGFNVSKLFLIRFVSERLRQIRQMKWKALVVAGTLTVMTTLFTLVAALRAQVLQASGVKESVGEPAFVAISLVFFCGIWLAHTQTEGIRNDVKAHRQKRHDHRRARELRKKKKRLTERLRELRNLRLDVDMSGALDEHEAKSLLDMLDRHYHSTVNQWLALYLKGRRTKGETIPEGIEKIEVKPLFESAPVVSTNGAVARTVMILALVVTSLFSACDMVSDEQLPIDRRVVLIDRTDEFAIAPSEESISPLCSVDRLRQARHVIIRSITSVGMSDRLTMNLPAYRQFGTWDDSWQGYRDTEFREGQLSQFEKQVKAKLDSISGEQVGFPHTSLVAPLMHELKELSQHGEDDRQAFVFSDLGEHTNGRNWLRGSADFQKMKALDPEVWESIEGTDNLSLHGVKIFFIYHPEDTSEEAYLVRAIYLKHFLKQAGAEVSVQSRVRTIRY